MKQVSARQYSKMRGRSYNLVMRWIKQGMPCIRIPKGASTWYRVNVEAADAWVEKNTRKRPDRKAAEGEKWCNVCDKYLPLDHFWANQSGCKECRGWKGGVAKKRRKSKPKSKPKPKVEAEILPDIEEPTPEMLDMEPDSVGDLEGDILDDSFLVGDVFEDLESLDRFG